MACFAVFAYEYYEKSVKPLAITFAALALLFQPFAKIALGRTMWNVVDVVAALGLILLVYKQLLLSAKTQKSIEILSAMPINRRCG